MGAFKLSKYPITSEQYEAFCVATGRPKPWGSRRGKFPVSQVTWYDEGLRGMDGLPASDGGGVGIRGTGEHDDGVFHRRGTAFV